MEDNLFTPQLLLSASLVSYRKKQLHWRRVRSDSLSFHRNVETTVSQVIVLSELNGGGRMNRLHAQSIFSEKRIISRLAGVVRRDLDSLPPNAQTEVAKTSGFDNTKSLKKYLGELKKFS